MNRQFCRSILVAILALTCFAAPTAAQDPLPQSDPATELYRSAQLLEAEGAYELADALMDYVLRRYPESPAAAEIRAARAAPDSRQVEDSGRTELVVWSTLYGLWLGVAIPGMLSVDDSAIYGLGLLIGGPAGFGTGWGLTHDRPISDGQAGAITWGGTWGTWQGFGWAQVFEPGSECPDRRPDPFYYCAGGPSAEATIGWMAAGGLAGTGAGIAAARSLDISPGDATMVSLGSLWGTWYGVALGVIAGIDGDDTLMTTALLGGNVGGAAGALLARSYPISRSQARIASIMGVAGGLAGAGIALITQPEDAKVAMAIPATTSALGLVLGAQRIRFGPGNGGEEIVGEGGDWTLGGPLFPTTVRGPGGAYRTAVGVTLVSGRF